MARVSESVPAGHPCSNPARSTSKRVICLKLLKNSLAQGQIWDAAGRIRIIKCKVARCSGSLLCQCFLLDLVIKIPNVLLYLYSCVLYLLSQKMLVKVVTTPLLELTFLLVRLALRYLNRSLPKSPWMLDKPEVLAGVTKRPRFLPWEFDTLTKNTYNTL